MKVQKPSTRVCKGSFGSESLGYRYGLKALGDIGTHWGNIRLILGLLKDTSKGKENARYYLGFRIPCRFLVRNAVSFSC